MSVKVHVEMCPVRNVIARIGIDRKGAVQRFVTSTINRRITKYMPYRTGALSTKLKFIKSDTEIEVNAPYAAYQYYGKVMVNSATGKGPALIPGVGYRYKKGTVLRTTDRDLRYDTTKNPMAGPYWDRRLMASEGAQIAQEVQAYVNRRR